MCQAVVLRWGPRRWLGLASRTCVVNMSVGLHTRPRQKIVCADTEWLLVFACCAFDQLLDQIRGMNFLPTSLVLKIIFLLLLGSAGSP